MSQSKPRRPAITIKEIADTIRLFVIRSKESPSHLTMKERIEIVQGVITILAIVVGGLWTYQVFIKERREYPHANIEQKISHVELSKSATLLRVGLELTNTGTSLMSIGLLIVRVQQVLPILPCPSDGVCAGKEISIALENVDRQEDRFSWALLGERKVTTDVDIEPGERQTLDFEFAIPPDVKLARVYVYIRNEQKFKEGNDVGWTSARYYNVRAPMEE
jgi:hypothetical protein